MSEFVPPAHQQQLQYVYRRPAYRENTVLFSACLFGLSFIILGNMAGNAISFAIRILEASNSFSHASKNANGYAQAFLAVIFAYSGFEQPNYVLGEISRPHHKYPISMVTAVSVVCIFYLAVNICYVSIDFLSFNEPNF